jgi:dihydropteroate synthase
MAAKGVVRAVELRDVDNRAANLLKQEMLSLGAEAAVSHVVSRFEKGNSTVLLLGTLAQYKRLIPRLARQPFGLKQIAPKIELALSNYMVCCDAPVLMGILNVTPDSFSDGGRYNNVEAALAHAIAMARDGAGIIDIGGQSTRPGAKALSAKEEMARVVPVIRALAKRIKTPLSIDTFQPEVARAALDAGATIINDITALRYKNGAMARLAAKSKAQVVLMHMQGTPATMQKDPKYEDVVAEIAGFFEERINFAVGKGIAPERIILDPGIGFGKTVGHNLYSTPPERIYGAGQAAAGWPLQQIIHRQKRGRNGSLGSPARQPKLRHLGRPERRQYFARA